MPAVESQQPVAPHRAPGNTARMELCRLCGGSVSRALGAKLLDRYDVSFFRCNQCHSLQSEDPYWLAEAYESAIADIDTGAVGRNLIFHAAIAAAVRILGVQGRFLDFGGGTGMLCRLLRDSGFDAYVYDAHADPTYARPFFLEIENVQAGSIGLLSAIEVFEHFANPAADMGRLFAIQPQVLFATTVLYDNQGEDWWYLATQSGQHIFFYSRKALAQLASSYGYDYFNVGGIHIFSKKIVAAWQKFLLRGLLSSLGFRAWRVWMAAKRQGRYADEDFDMLCKKIAEKNQSSER